MTIQSAALQPGSHVAELQINAILGVGAFGVTYLVTDPAIGTRFALKEYLPANLVLRQIDGEVLTIDDDSVPLFASGLKTFLNEARMVAALDHPNIVKVLRYFEANGTAYFLMPYYEGQALHNLLESDGNMNRDAARSLMLPLMNALEHLHNNGVIHQDIKPANIYMTDKGDPILLDFGVAAAGRNNIGSEGYAAPEQFLGRDEENSNIGSWTDIYALAATLYRCVSGRIPVSATLRQEAVAEGQTDPLTAFSELAPADQYGGLTDAVELGLKLLPNERPANVDAWKKSFESLDWHRTVVVAASSDKYAQESREWLPIILLAVLLLSMAAIGVFLLTDKAADQTTQEPSSVIDDEPSPTETGRRLEEPTSIETQRWQAALKADTVEAYREFIKDYATSVYTKQAETQLNILDEKYWQELSAEDSIPAYKDYLEAFPLGIHQVDAMQRIDAMQQEEARKERQRLEQERLEKLAWDEANASRSIASFDKYITEWPAGQHIEEAQRLRRLLQDQSNDDKAFQSALKLDNKDAFQAYIDAFSQGAHVTSALQHIDDLTLRPGKSFKDCVGCPAMVVIPAAAYWQGSDDSSSMALSMEKPRRLVTIDEPFAVSTHEVTMAQWDACFDDKGCESQPSDNGWGRGDRPVIMVSWNDAGQYVHWISKKTGQSYRLPSESEWEYFARAGEEGEWPGGGPESVCKYANIAGAETGFRWQHAQCMDTLALGTATVGSFMPNSFGLYDTSGNVAEWTADCMNLSYIDAPVDGSAWGRGLCSSHMTRGGSWITGSNEIRLPARFNLKNGDRNDFTGFRVVRIIEE